MSLLSRIFVKDTRDSQPEAPGRSRLGIEQLEDRVTPTALVAGTANGLFRYNANPNYGTVGWGQLNTVPPTAVAITEFDNQGNYGVVAASFAGFGTYLWNARTGWQEISTSVATQLDIEGAFLVANFPGNGVWEYAGFAGWKQLNGNDAVNLAVDVSGDVAASFAGFGTYIHRVDGGWTELTTVVATSLDMEGNDYIAASFAGFGTFRWQTNTGWITLTESVADSVSVNANGVVTSSFTGFGTWLYWNGWSQITPSVVTDLAFANDYGIGGLIGNEFYYRNPFGAWQPILSGVFVSDAS